MGRGTPSKVLSRAIDLVGLVASVAVGAMMVTIVTEAALRYLVSGSIPAAFDLSQYWYMVLIGFGALALAQRRSEHIEATFVFDLLPPPTRRMWLLFSATLTAAVMVLIAWTTWEFAEVNRLRGEFSAGSGLPLWPVRYIVPVGAAALAIEVMLQAVRDLTTTKDGSAA